MAILEHDIRLASGFTDALIRPYRFTRNEYHALEDILHDKNVELIEGEIIEMSPIGNSHAAVTQPITDILAKAFGNRFTVRSQVPIALGDESTPSEPEPDVAVVIGGWRDYLNRKPVPSDIKLIVEIAESSLQIDRTVKGMLYAQAGIAEYWIVNLTDIQLEVYREPSETGYLVTHIYKSDDIIEPIFAPGSSIAIAEFMP